jgi:hypothetical protein
LFHSFNPRIQTVALVKNELEQQSSPRRVILQIIIKLGGHRAQLRQIVPRDRRQIVMLVVISHVQREEIDRAVITECFLVEIVGVMLLNPTRAHRMQPNREEKREHEIKKSGPPAEVNNCGIVRRRARKIHKEPPVPHLDGLQPGWPGQLEKRKEHEPDRLAIPFVAHQPCLPMIREISVVFVIALMRMMLQMINAKTHRAGREIREIGDDGHHFVPAFAPKNQVVGRIVDDHVVGMICERADAIRDEKAEPPVTKSQRAHPIRDRCLDRHDRDRDQRRPPIAHHQLANFRVRLDDRSRPARVWLVNFRLIKRGLHVQFHCTIIARCLKRRFSNQFFRRSKRLLNLSQFSTWAASQFQAISEIRVQRKAKKAARKRSELPL